MPHRRRGTVGVELSNCMCQQFWLHLGRAVLRGSPSPQVFLHTHSQQTVGQRQGTEVKHSVSFTIEHAFALYLILQFDPYRIYTFRLFY